MVIGHEAILNELRVIAATSEPPHALLFAGAEGTGRAVLALELAKLLNCERATLAGDAPQTGLFADQLPYEGSLPCGLCRQCRLIEGGRHPDVVVVGPGDTLCRTRPGEASHDHPDSRDIRICQVRGMVDMVSRFPFEGRVRVVIIDPAERLALQASHGLLQTLEAPPGHTVFMLISSAPEAMIETILSRCRRIDVGPVARETIEAGLVARGLDPTAARAAAGASRGRPGRALTFAANPSLMEDRARVLQRLARIAAGSFRDRVRYVDELRERWTRNRADALADLEAWEALWEEALREAAKGATGAGQREVVDALNAVAQARADLLANCLPRNVFDLMLLGFPRRTLAPATEEPHVVHA